MAMVKQRLEKTLKDILKVQPGTYHIKLQVNPLAHHKMPGDFLHLIPGKNYIIECKECNGTNFPFTRYTQRAELERFDSALWHNEGWLLISFSKGTRKKTAYYAMPCHVMAHIIDTSEKKSVNEFDLTLYKINYEELKELKWLK